jgi:hypothetical protein
MRYFRSALISGLAAFLAIVAALVAPAASAQEPTPQPVISETQFVVTGFNPAIAAKYGYPTQNLNDIRYGNCGSSYLYLDPLPRGLAMRTGFSVNGLAISYSWAVDVYGPSGYRVNWGGGLAFRASWAGTNNRTGLRPGAYSGLVTTGTALLADGRICTATGPAASRVVF